MEQNTPSETCPEMSVDQARALYGLVAAGHGVEVDGRRGMALVDHCQEIMRAQRPDIYNDFIANMYVDTVEDRSADRPIYRSLHYAQLAADADSVEELCTEDLQVAYELQLEDMLRQTGGAEGLIFARHDLRGGIETDWYASLQYAGDLVRAAEELIERHYVPTEIGYKVVVNNFVSVVGDAINSTALTSDKKEQLYKEFKRVKSHFFRITTEDNELNALYQVFDTAEERMEHGSTPSIRLAIKADRYEADPSSKESKRMARRVRRQYAGLLETDAFKRYNALTELGREALRRMGIISATEKVMTLAVLATDERMSLTNR